MNINGMNSHSRSRISSREASLTPARPFWISLPGSAADSTTIITPPEKPRQIWTWFSRRTSTRSSAATAGTQPGSAENFPIFRGPRSTRTPCPRFSKAFGSKRLSSLSRSPCTIPPAGQPAGGIFDML